MRQANLAATIHDEGGGHGADPEFLRALVVPAESYREAHMMSCKEAVCVLRPLVEIYRNNLESLGSKLALHTLHERKGGEA